MLTAPNLARAHGVRRALSGAEGLRHGETLGQGGT